MGKVSFPYLITDTTGDLTSNRQQQVPLKDLALDQTYQLAEALIGPGAGLDALKAADYCANAKGRFIKRVIAKMYSDSGGSPQFGEERRDPASGYIQIGSFRNGGPEANTPGGPDLRTQDGARARYERYLDAGGRLAQTLIKREQAYKNLVPLEPPDLGVQHLPPAHQDVLGYLAYIAENIGLRRYASGSISDAALAEMMSDSPRTVDDHGRGVLWALQHLAVDTHELDLQVAKAQSQSRVCPDNAIANVGGMPSSTKPTAPLPGAGQGAIPDALSGAIRDAFRRMAASLAGTVMRPDRAVALSNPQATPPIASSRSTGGRSIAS